MRNANTFEGMAASMSGHVNFDMMYDSHYGRVHRKKVGGDLAAQLEEYVFLMETAENDTVVALHSSNLRAVTKGPSHTHKKPKRKPVKGTKPYTKIPYKFEDVEVGDVVGYKTDGTNCTHKVISKDVFKWEAKNGTGYIQWKPTPAQEAHILKPYKEPVKTQEEKVSAPEKYYQIGDRFETSDGSKVMLCRVHALKAQLIVYEGSDTGNRWSDRTLEINSDSAVKAREVLEFGSLLGVSIKKI